MTTFAPALGPSIAVLHNASRPSPLLATLLERLGPERVHLCTTRTLDDGLRQAHDAVSGGASALIAAGGDGTVLSAADACAGTSCALALLPLGTANDLAAALGWLTPAAALDEMSACTIRSVDALEVEAAGPDGPVRRTGLSTVGAGLFARVVAREQSPAGRRALRWLGPLASLGLTVDEGVRLRPFDGRLSLDGQVVEQVFTTVDLFGVPSMGGFTVWPGARLDSGHLQGFASSITRPAAMLGVIASGLRTPGAQLDHADIIDIGHDMQPSVLRLETDHPVPVHIHGEPVGHTPMTVTCRPRALRLLAP